MPIQNKDLGKYNRPGIFINEIDNSIIDLPVQEVLINLVPGFSKKGPVNAPIYITSKKQFKDIFGEIDKGLERKGSYFHRTCLKMIESGPIWALNLLLTNDDRDKANWKSISCASNYMNEITKNMPYSRLFNRQDFWMRDSESFLDYVNDPAVDYDRLLHLSNLGNKVTTTFMFKSKLEMFDITAEDWYGGPTKVPAYINGKDWISDYMISVLILDGDWTNYDVLSADPLWGQFFTKDGLDKWKVQDFVDQPTVSTLGYYDASLIPYFKDINGKDMYVKSLINDDTNKTGLFCAYFEDEMLDADFPIGKVDLVGQGIVGSVATDIDFLSYKETISEEVSFKEKELNALGNTFGNYVAGLTSDFSSASQDHRMATNTNHFVSGMQITGGTSTDDSYVHEVEEFLSAGTSDYGTKILLTAGTFVGEVDDVIFFNKDHDSIIGFLVAKPYYIVSINGLEIEISETLGGTPLSFLKGISGKVYISSVRKTYDVTGTVDVSYFNLGSRYKLKLGNDINIQFGPLYYDDITTQEIERYDVLYLTRENDAEIHIMKGEQALCSDGAELPYFTLPYDENLILGYVQVKLSAGTMETSYNSVTVDGNGYMPLEDIIVSGNSVAGFTSLNFGHTQGLTNYNDYKQIRYRNAYDEIENKLDDGRGVIIKQSDGSKYSITLDKFSSRGYSNTSAAQIQIYGIDYTEYKDSTDYGFLIYFLDNEFVVNDGNNFNVIKSELTIPGTNEAIIGKYSNMYNDFYDGNINNGDYVNPKNDTGLTAIDNNYYIEGYFDVDGLLTVTFSDNVIEDFSGDYTSELIVHSNDSYYKQTVDIKELVYDGVLDLTKVYKIKVDKNRYSELIRGIFIEAYYNEDDLEYGQAPKTLTRIIKIENDLNNVDLKIITCDAPIMCSPSFGDGGYTTMTYPTIEQYVDTYKGIKLVPFVISSESIPNKTETRQSDILDLLIPTTNLGKGLINKNKISWRYLIDSFGLGLTSKSKQQYTDLCGSKLNSLGFISAPSVKDLKKSSSPSFVNDDMTLNTDYLKAGGDETKNPAFLYSFSEGLGRSTVAYFFPYVTVSDGGVPKDVPPAAWIASTYMKKFLSSSSAIQPWTIAAGISNGRVTDIAAVEMDLGNDDLVNLYAMGLNPIVKTRNSGYCINSESTAQVFPYSSLSVIHSREVLIELENALYNMLLRYQWRFNTGPIRAEIKYKADKICQDIQNRDGLYDFKNVIDETNNTNYIIDLQMGVLDTYIEIIKGMGIIVNNITILKKGDIQSGGFM